MEFCFLSEGELLDRSSYYHRYQELVREVLRAEEVGFDAFALSEQHFMHGATVPAPECFFSHLIPLTSRIRFIYAIALTPHQINHPLRIAERVAMQDLFSNGRMELGLGRVNTTLTMKAFGVNPAETREQMFESIEIIRRAFTEEPFSFDGKYFKIPNRYLVPRPLQQPHPPMHLAATSPEMQTKAAALGLGSMTASSFFGIEWLEKLAGLYRDAAGSNWGKNPYAFGVSAYLCCAPTDEEAREIAAGPLFRTADFSLRGYSRLAHTYDSYKYMLQADDCLEKIKDLDWLINESGGLICGSPETCIRQLKRLEDLGATKLLLRIDGQGHKNNIQTIEMFGKYVIPHINTQYRRPSDAMELHTAR